LTLSYLINFKCFSNNLVPFEIQGVSHKVSEPQGIDRRDQNQQKVVSEGGV